MTSYPPPLRATVEQVVDAVARECGVRIPYVYGHARYRSPTVARHVAWYLLRCRCGQSYSAIARAFDRHHTSIMSGVQRVLDVVGLQVLALRIERAILAPAHEAAS